MHISILYGCGESQKEWQRRWLHLESQRIFVKDMISLYLHTMNLSFMNGFMAITGLLNGTRTLSSALPSLVMCGTMLIGTMIVPTISRRYDKKQKIRTEKMRKQKYTEYLTEKQSKLLLIKKIQKQILEENYLSLEMCNDIILNKKRKLWERQIKHNASNIQ